MSTGQVAADLGVSAQTVRQLITAGEIPATLVSMGGERKHYRITPHALRAYRERRQTTRRIGGSR